MTPEILYEDDYILAVDKPTNLIVHQSVDPQRANLLKEFESKNRELFLINRLDKDTSGVILIAKTKESVTIFSNLFSNKEIEKTYVAIVEGEIDFNEKVVSNHLGPVKGLRNIHGSVKTGGRKAETIIKKISSSSGFSLVNAYPKTGRTHQIRVHLTELGFPIAGDTDYGAPFRHQFKRMMLHAHSVEFTHPYKNEKIKITAPLPEDFRESLNYLGLYDRKRGLTPFPIVFHQICRK